MLVSPSRRLGSDGRRRDQPAPRTRPTRARSRRSSATGRLRTIRFPGFDEEPNEPPGSSPNRGADHVMSLAVQSDRADALSVVTASGCGSRGLRGRGRGHGRGARTALCRLSSESQGLRTSSPDRAMSSESARRRVDRAPYRLELAGSLGSVRPFARAARERSRASDRLSRAFDEPRRRRSRQHSQRWRRA